MLRGRKKIKRHEITASDFGQSWQLSYFVICQAKLGIFSSLLSFVNYTLSIRERYEKITWIKKEYKGPEKSYAE